MYYPEGTIKALPAIVEIHGGGWMYGNKELNKKYAMDLARRGFTVVNINYHLVQEKRYPVQIKDVFAAFNWIEKNYKNYHIDIDRVFITGDSAGAHLAAVSTAILYNESVKERLNISSELDIKAAGLICGVYDLNIYKSIKKFIVGKYANVLLGERAKQSVNKDLFAFKDVYAGNIPPLYLMSSRQDFIREQTLAFVKYIEANNIRHKLRYYDKGNENKLMHVFNVMYPHYKESVEVNDEMCDFFLSACR
ncbi:MAG: alpha/beta hydrolase [Christensenellales bacterium]